MRRFRFDFPGCRIIKLDTSYRLPEALSAVTEVFVGSLQGRISKTWNAHSRSSTSTTTSTSTATPPHSLDPALTRNELKYDYQKRGFESSQNNRWNDETGTGTGTGSGAGMEEDEAALEVRCLHSEHDELDWMCTHISGSSHSSSSSSSSSSTPTSTGVGTGAGVGAGRRREHSIAILCRDKHDMKKVSDALRKHSIPYRARGQGAWALPSGGALQLDLLRLLVLPDNDISFEAALDNDIMAHTLPDHSGHTATILPVLKAHSSITGESLLKSARKCVLSGRLSGQAGLLVGRFLQHFDAWREDISKKWVKGGAAKDLLLRVLHDAYYKRWSGDAGMGGMVMAANELSSKASTYESLEAFLAAVRVEGDLVVESRATSDLQQSPFLMAPPTASASATTSQRSIWTGNGFNHQQQQQQPIVWVMTMHSAKGLEFDEAILPFWTEGNVPRIYSAEERRLAFVSLTRARKKVTISYSLKQDKDSGRVGGSTKAPNQLGQSWRSPSLSSTSASTPFRSPSPFIRELMSTGYPCAFYDMTHSTGTDMDYQFQKHQQYQQQSDIVINPNHFHNDFTEPGEEEDDEWSGLTRDSLGSDFLGPRPGPSRSRSRAQKGTVTAKGKGPKEKGPKDSTNYLTSRAIEAKDRAKGGERSGQGQVLPPQNEQ